MYIRKLDHINRLTIPKDVRELLKLCSNDSLEFFIKDNKIIIRLYEAQEK